MPSVNMHTGSGEQLLMNESSRELLAQSSFQIAKKRDSALDHDGGRNSSLNQSTFNKAFNTHVSRTSFYSTLGKDGKSRMRRIHSNTVNPDNLDGKKTFDTAVSNTKFFQNLRDGQTVHQPLINQRNNPLLQLHSTEPTRRFDREFKKRDFSLLKRSGFNAKYDSAPHASPVFNTDRSSLSKLANYEDKKKQNKIDN